MQLSLLFWILMLLWLVLGVAPNWPSGNQASWRPFGGSLLLFVLIAMLGWKTFGPAVHG